MKSRCASCTHTLEVHQDPATGLVATCRITKCGCTAFVEDPLTAPAGVKSRRVCIDVPDGYVVSLSLIPNQEAPDAT